MTRDQAIAAITQRLPSLDDEHVRVVASIVCQLDETSALGRRLTPEEFALVEQSKEDFRTGRTLTLEDYEAEMRDFWATMEAKHGSAA